MLDRYSTPDDVNMRLDGCIVRYQDQPYYANGRDGMFLNLRRLGPEHILSDAVQRVNANSPELDISSMELGYMNMSWPSMNGTPHASAAFVSRLPYRRQKAAVHSSNLTMLSAGEERTVGFLNDYFWTAGFVELANNTYPRPVIAFPDLPNGQSVAISRQFAIKKNAKEWVLYFNGENIGKCPRAAHQYLIRPEFNNTLMMLRLEELGIPAV